MRSFIAVLALVCGVASLLATCALTDGEAAAEKQFLVEWGGVEKIFLEDKPLPPGQEKHRGVSPGKTMEDVRAIARACPLVRYVSPLAEIHPNLAVTYRNKRADAAMLRMVSPDTSWISNLEMASGRFLGDLDMSQRLCTCVIGNAVAKSLNLGKEPVGKGIQLNGAVFKVVGITKDKKWEQANQTIFIPATTAQRLFFIPATATDPERNDNLMFSRIAVKVWDLDHLDAAIEQIRSVLKVTHRGLDDVGVNTLQDWAEVIEGRMAATKFTGQLTAIVSLFAGGVGITNVMLASIRQRMREIGTRRAIGATGAAIFVQIITETITLSVCGGLLGLAAGVGILKLSTLGMPDAPVPILTAGAWVLSFSSAIVVGVCSGIYPAYKGASVSPTEALRYE